jgi:two-component system nitrate/nitrite response regulator NarL
MVVDDHALLAQTLAAELAHHGCQVSVVDAPSATTVLQEAQAFEPDVVLLDLFLGKDVGTSVPLIGPLTSFGAEVLVLTGMTDDLLIASCFEAGAAAVLSKTKAIDHVLETVDRVARHERVQPVVERERLVDQLRRARREQRARLAPFEHLTRRERQVLAALMEGRSAGEIAREAVVTLATVRTQIRAILQKLGVSSQLAAVALAHHAGWNAGWTGNSDRGLPPSLPVSA